MIFVYHCYRGAHMSVVAAGIHLALLPDRPNPEDILDLDYFDCLQVVDMGVPVYAGCDKDGNQVYFVGLKNGGLVFSRFLDSIVGELGIDMQYKAVDCLKCIGPLTRLGGLMTNYPRFRIWGRRLAAWEIARDFVKLKDLVLQAKAEQV